MNRTLLAALIASAVALPALAGEREKDGEKDKPFFNIEIDTSGIVVAANETADAWRRWAEDFSNDMRTSMSTMFSGRMDSSRVVKDAPYSAEVVTENNQTLSDGNVISKRTSGMVYRDAMGRTRQESGGDGKHRAIYINDPVAGQRIILTPGAKRAIVTPRSFAHAYSYDQKNKQVVRLDGTEIRVEDGKVFVDGKQVTGKVELMAGRKKVVVDGAKVTIDGKDVVDLPKVSVRTITDEGGTRREEVRVQVISPGDGRGIVVPVPPVPPVPPVSPHAHPVPPLPPIAPGPMLPGMGFDSMGKLGKGTTVAIGTKDFEGVRAEGKRTTWTIPAGEIGNRAPIEVTSESWYSPELQLTVYSRYNDPRKGESIYRLAQLKRAEPSPDLFRVPEGYETMSKEVEREKARAERDKARAERDRERQREQLQREQERLERERERLKKEQERLEKERERLRG